MDNDLKALLKSAVAVAYWRDGDISTEDGTFAATDLDQMIYLEQAIEKAFGLDAKKSGPAIFDLIDGLVG